MTIKPSREEVAVVLDAFQTIAAIDELFDGLVPPSYMNLLRGLRAGIMRRDLIKNEFPSVSELYDSIPPEGQEEAFAHIRARLDAHRLAKKKGVQQRAFDPILRKTK